MNIRVEHAIVVSTMANVRDSVQTVIVDHLMSHSDGLYSYLGNTESGMGVACNSWSKNVEDFTGFKWDILGGQIIDKNIWMKPI